jgi:hypothetical protein
MLPFRQFGLLSTERKRTLLAERFQQIKVKDDYRIVNAYLIAPPATASRSLATHAAVLAPGTSVSDNCQRL